MKLFKHRQRSLRPAIRAGIFLSQHPEREEVYLTRRKGFVKLAIQGGAGMRMTQGLCVHTSQHLAQSRGIFAPILMAEAASAFAQEGIAANAGAVLVQHLRRVHAIEMIQVRRMTTFVQFCRSGAGVSSGADAAADVLGHGEHLPVVEDVCGAVLGRLRPPPAQEIPDHQPCGSPHPR